MENLNELRDEIYKDAVAHGLWDDANRLDDEEARLASGHAIWRKVLELIAEYERPGHYAEELADVIIMSLSTAGYLASTLTKRCGRRWRLTEGENGGTENEM